MQRNSYLTLKTQIPSLLLSFKLNSLCIFIYGLQESLLTFATSPLHLALSWLSVTTEFLEHAPQKGHVICAPGLVCQMSSFCPGREVT